MKLSLIRYSSENDDTLGMLMLDCDFICYTLEDEYRTIKKYGETRIPEGTYRLGLRKEGGFNDRYSKKFPDIHIGMIQILDVPNFEYILIHIGNNDDDTAGCVLVGNTAKQNITDKGFIGDSTGAYKRIYPKIAEAIESGETVTIEIHDINLFN